MLLVLIDIFFLDSCKDLKTFCKYGPSCEADVVKQQCPRLCGTCVSGKDDSCKDLQFFCKFNPSCENENVKTQCPKLCKACLDTGNPRSGGSLTLKAWLTRKGYLTNIKV